MPNDFAIDSLRSFERYEHCTIESFYRRDDNDKLVLAYEVVTPIVPQMIYFSQVSDPDSWEY